MRYLLKMQDQSLIIDKNAGSAPETAWGGRWATLVFAAACLVPLALFFALARHQYVQQIDAATLSVRRTVQILEEHALRVFEAQQLIIDQVDRRIEGLGWEAIAGSQELHEALRQAAASSPHVDGLWLVGPDGTVANSAAFAGPPEPYKVSDRAYFNALRTRDELHFGEMIVGRSQGTLNFNLSRRRTPRDLFDGLILVTASLSYFTDFWQEASLRPDFAAGLFREDGEILARFPPLDAVPPVLSASSPLRLAMQQAEEGVINSRSTIDGRSRIYGYSRIGETPVFVGYGVDLDDLLAGWRRETVEMGVVALLGSALLASALALILGQRRRLRVAARTWQETAGRLGAEVERRLRAEDVAEERERILGQLRDVTAQRRIILDNMSEGVIALGPEGRAIYANDRALAILGLPDEGGIDLDALVRDGRIAGAEGQPIAEAEAPHRRALGGEAVVETELRVTRPGGSEIHCDLRGAPLRDGAGQVSGAVLTLADVTERRRDALRKELLSSELDHRVRNMLATIVSMIRNSDAPRRSKDDFVRTLTGRVRAMARTHALLSERRWGAVPVADIVRDEVETFGGTARLSVEGPPGLFLPPKQTVDLALVLHELCTNATKHGAWSVPEGRVALRWKITGTLPRRAAFLWTEHGGPAPAPAPEREGFGSALLRGVFQGSDDLSIDYAPEGLRCAFALDLQDAPLAEDRARPGPGMTGAGGAGTGTAGAPPAEAGGVRSSAGAGADGLLAGPGEEGALQDLAGLRVIVVEDEPVVRMDLVETLQEAGATVVAAAGSVAEALRRAEDTPADAAVLDVNLGGLPSTPVAEALLARGVRIVFATGYESLRHLPLHLSSQPHLRKPVTAGALAAALARPDPEQG